MMITMCYIFSGFLVCSFFLWVFSRREATDNMQWYITLIVWGVFLFEFFRYLFPCHLTLPQPYRHIQHQAEHALISIYGWEVIRYVSRKINMD